MKTMRVLLSTYEKNTNIGQEVYFINVTNSFEPLNEEPKKIKYSDRGNTSLLINYEDYKDDKLDCNYKQGYSPISSGGDGESFASIYKREVRTNDDGTVEHLTKLSPVLTDVNNFKIRDFNISNNREYQYVLYLDYSPTTGEVEKTIKVPAKTSWEAWSITELHPVGGNKKQFTATADDVWLFNLNVSTGEQTQNISRNEQQTLGQFNKYSQGRMNYVSGNVSCLLGSEVVPASYANKNGGYIERRIFDAKPTSNERIDMLLAWRKVVYSPNPKLLKDRAGQSFLVTLNSSSNQPMDAVRIQPNTISFNWTQIGTLDDVQIVDNSLE